MTQSHTRRSALACMAWSGAGTVFALSGGVPVAFALGEESKMAGLKPLFVQISDSHIGFNKDANPDVGGTLARVVTAINAMPQQPGFILHTGDVTHLSKPEQFDQAAQLLKGLRASELHVVPGEHDVIDNGPAFMERYGTPSGSKGYYSFDASGVHFVALINVLNFKQNGLGTLGHEQLEWLEDDLKGRKSSQPIVVFAHMPLWSIYEPWGWGTSDADQAMGYLKRFGSVTVLNGHIHQIVQKTEGHISFHTARSTAYPQPVAGTAAAPGPLKVPADQLAQMLGLTSVSLHRHALSLTDNTLA
ncbi:MAG: metallophosphoesterase [Rhizomicrobium sp.]|nr:metallophosphoesterase [Rhizomicrobium sp.]